MNLRTMIESLKGLLKPSTVPYPYKSIPPAEGYRGKPLYDREKCIGCGACSQVCPAGAITLKDEGAKRTLRVWYGHCAFCGRCEDSCTWEGIKLSREFLVVVYNKEEAEDRVEVELEPCSSCKKYFVTSRQLAKLFEKAADSLSKREASIEDYRKLVQLCPFCRFKPENLRVAHRFMLKMG